MINKLPKFLMAAGISLCLWYVGYRMYLAAAQQAVEKMAAAGTKTVTAAAGFVAVTEGEVVHAGDGWTAVAYYYEWDGASYRRIIKRVNEAFPEHTRMPVVYCIGWGPGTCLAVGFCRERMLMISLFGLLMLTMGLTLFMINKRKEKNNG